jgi:hypothetical protein
VDILINYAKDRWKELNSIVDDENLTSREKLLLVIIFRYVNHITGYASPSRKRIKKLARITDNRTLDNPLDSLIAKGYISREKGNGVNSRYYLKTNCSSMPYAEITSEAGVEIRLEAGVGITPLKENIIKENKIYKNLTFIDDSITNVELTEEAFNKLISKFGTDLTKVKIIDLENSIVNGKCRFYKDHYKLLLSWCSREINMVRPLPVSEDGIQRLKELN